MRILYYTWFENSQEDMEETLISLGYEVVKCNIPFKDYEEDEAFLSQFFGVLQQYQCDCIFSFNFFPMIAKTAEKYRIKYISWVYDCPHWTLYSPAVKSAYNYIFVFDRAQYLTLSSFGLLHVHHLALAVNAGRLCRLLGEPKPQPDFAAETGNEVSFVGSLYENNLYDQIQYLPDDLKGYLEGTMEAQQRIYGYNFVKEMLTKEIVERMNAYLLMELPVSYLAGKEELYAAMLNGKITSQERMRMLIGLSKICPVTLYTASDMAMIPGAKAGGTVEYMTEMPSVFRKTAINLNMTLRSIESGIPLRALDIMGAGGFLLSNYQPELAEQFEDGKDLALFGSLQEMQEKALYYLEHEKERQEIAFRGFQKVRQLYSYEAQVKKMMQLAGVES